MFCPLILFGLQYCFNSIVIPSGSEQGWASGSEDHFVARALYTFQGDGNNELSFQTGTNINIAPKGW